jgi:hypothetical protein
MGRSILLLLALAAGQESGDEYFKFAKDTVWTYSRVEVGKAKDVTKKVVKVEGGKVFVEETTVEKGGKAPSGSHTSMLYVEEGYLKQAAVRDGKPDAAVNVFKLSSKRGDHWRLVPSDAENKAEAMHMGVVEVETPAGTYKNAVQIRIAMNFGTVDGFLVPNVGFVKETVTVPPDAPDVQVLLKFTPGGK